MTTRVVVKRCELCPFVDWDAGCGAGHWAGCRHPDHDVERDGEEAIKVCDEDYVDDPDMSPYRKLPPPAWCPLRKDSYLIKLSKTVTAWEEP